jgi:hypothetical protein
MKKLLFGAGILVGSVFLLGSRKNKKGSDTYSPNEPKPEWEPPSSVDPTPPGPVEPIPGTTIPDDPNPNDPPVPTEVNKVKAGQVPFDVETELKWLAQQKVSKAWGEHYQWAFENWTQEIDHVNDIETYCAEVWVYVEAGSKLEWTSAGWACQSMYYDNSTAASVEIVGPDGNAVA